MKRAQHLVLVGPMGAGKSTIGRRLAADLGVVFHDSDELVRERTGVEIAHIFDVEGEAGFRAREKSAIEALLALDPGVIATGGGAVLDTDNRRQMQRHATVIYLETSVDEQLRRTGQDTRRPLLQTDNPRGRLEALMAERDPLYRDAAHITVNTDHTTIAQTVRDIHASLPGSGMGPSDD